MFEKWGLVAHKHNRLVPLVIIFFIALLYLLAGTKLDQRMSQEGWDDPGSDSTLAAQLELDTFGRDNNGDVILMVEAPPGEQVDQPATVAAMKKQLADLHDTYPAQIDHIISFSDVRNPALATKDKRLAFAAIGLKGNGEQTLKDFRTIKPALIPPTGQYPDGVKVKVAGATAIADALDNGMTRDMHRAEVYALPAVGILLLIVFGSLVAALMPLAVGILSILGSMGVLALLAEVTQVNVFAQSIVTLLGLGLAIDYGLFMVSRFREEIAGGATTGDAVITTTATAGKTVVFSASMVAVALSGLLLFPQAFLKSIAYGAISAVGLAALLSLTLLPSIFSLLGKKVDFLSFRRLHADRDPEKGFWGAVPAWAIRHATAATLVIVAALVALTLPLAGITFGGINETYLPPGHSTRENQAEFDAHFPTYRTEPIKLVVTGADNKALVKVFTEANKVEGLTGRFAATTQTKDGVTVLSAGILDRSKNKTVVNELRQLTVPDGVHVLIGGTPALEIESIEALFNKLPWMAFYIIIATFILMSLTFGSLILPAKAVIMTMLGMGATLGILTAMFVNGVGSEFLGYSAEPLMSPVLVLIMAIIYGLSTDYEVFLVSRMVEARERGASTDRAITYGTAHTGSIITAAAIIMIVVCGAFGFSQIVMMKYIAFGMIAALLLDATIIRMVLVPAVMHLLKEDNWWAPRFVKIIAASLSHGAALPVGVIPAKKTSSGTPEQSTDLIPFTVLENRAAYDEAMVEGQ